MNPFRSPLRLALLPLFCAMLFTASASASAVLLGDYYRLGEDDPGAIPGQIGNALTIDSGFYKLDLSRAGFPTYSSDTTSRAPGSKLSMSFDNAPSPLDRPQVPSFYSLASPLTTNQPAFGLETWVKTSALAPVDSSGYAIIAASGTPLTSGFGFYQKDNNYIARIGATETKLAPASTTDWVHLGLVHEFDTDSLYVNGQLIASGPSDPASTPATGGFFLAGQPDGNYLFSGLIDETRFFAYNPLSAGVGSFSPSDFLIVPEPSAALLLLSIPLLLRRKR